MIRRTPGDRAQKEEEQEFKSDVDGTEPDPFDDEPGSRETGDEPGASETDDSREDLLSEQEADNYLRNGRDLRWVTDSDDDGEPR